MNTQQQQQQQSQQQTLADDFNETGQVISLDEVRLKNLCLVKVPYIYAHAGDGHDKISHNLRAIDYKVLTDLVSLALKIPILDNEESASMTYALIEEIINSTTEKEAAIYEFIRYIASMAENFELIDQYCDATNTGISFDMIRRYHCDNDLLLVYTEPATYEGCAFYSQLPPEQVPVVRQAMNDSDFNRMQYVLLHFEKILTFEPGYATDKTIRFINLTLFYTLLYIKSLRVEFHCTVDLRANITGFLIDAIVRTRVIQHWQQQPQSQKLLMDLTNNHDKNNYIVQMCHIDTPRERANFVRQALLRTLNKQQLAEKNKLMDQPIPISSLMPIKTLLDEFTYDWYMELVEASRIVVEDEPYYVFDNNFIIRLNTTKFPKFIAQFMQSCDPAMFEKVDIPDELKDRLRSVSQANKVEHSELFNSGGGIKTM